MANYVELNLTTGKSRTITETPQAEALRLQSLAEPLPRVIAQAIREVDSLALGAKGSFNTPGMEVVYLKKAEEAETVLKMGEGVADALLVEDQKTQFPFLSATVGVEGKTLWDVAGVVMAAHRNWKNKSSAIEKVRIEAKRALADAPSEVAVNSIMSRLKFNG